MVASARRAVNGKDVPFAQLRQLSGHLRIYIPLEARPVRDERQKNLIFQLLTGGSDRKTLAFQMLAAY